MESLRRGWQRSRLLVRVGWVAVAIMGVGLLANLALHRDAVTYAGTFTATGAMTTARSGATATLLEDGRVLVAGGSSGIDAVATAELYDPMTRTFAATGSMAKARAYASAALLPDGRVLIAGGNDPTGNTTAAQSSAELYDPNTGRFTPTGSLTAARAYSTLTLLADGRVLVAGGWSDAAQRDLASAELYDPTTGTFAATGSMHVGREAAAAALLPDGRVLIAGGSISVDANAHTETATAELYDPPTGTFSATGLMGSALEWRSATLLIDGRVLIAGGRGAGALANGSVAAEVYDPTTSAFNPTHSLSSVNAVPIAVGLVDGRVLLVGAPGPAELYDPIRGVFATSGAMLQPRTSATATVLADGEVLIAGGVTDTDYLASAELFH